MSRLVDKPEYICWKSMMGRCYTVSSGGYPYYGARGISVCKRWHVFANFIADMGKRPSGCSIERLDVNGNYTPENCVWATSEIQARNRRNNHVLTYAGKTMCVTDWAKYLGIRYNTILARLELGWSVEKALTSSGNRMLDFDGKIMSVSDWARYLNIGKSTLLFRLNKGWSVEKTLTTPITVRYSHVTKSNR